MSPASGSENRSSEENSSADEHDGSPSTSDSENLEGALCDTPFGARIEQQQTGFAFRPKKQQTQVKHKAGVEGKLGIRKPFSKPNFKRENKNRPTEQSSKKPVPRFRNVLEVGKRHSVDPRFDSLAGNFRDEAFKKRYAFLFDEQLPEEKSELRKQMKSTKSAVRKQELQSELTRIEQQIKAELEQRKRAEAQRAAKAKEREAVKTGKKPFFLKKSEQKKQELVRKYHELKASGKLEKAMAKRRKKNAAKDHRRIPSAR